MQFDLMQDTITPSAVSANPWAVAGYAGGNWPDYPALVHLFPRAHHFKILIGPWEGFDGDGMDCEKGDATVQQGAIWLPQAKPINVRLPTGYASASNTQELIDLTISQGMKREEFFVWSAHYDYKPHICAPGVCGYPRADFTQFTNHQFFHNLDGSWVPANGIFKDTVKPVLPPDPHHYRWMATADRNAHGLPGGPFHFTIEGKHVAIDERLTAFRYDELRREQTPLLHPHRAEIDQLKVVCELLGSRVANIAHEQERNGIVPWDDFRHFGWRRQQFMDRSNGRRMA
jgi:hypothetical protein